MFHFFHFFHQLYSTGTACVLSYRDDLVPETRIGLTQMDISSIKEFEMAQLAKDHKAAEEHLHKMEKKDWSVFVLLATYCHILYAIVLARVWSVLLCYNCPTTIYRDLYIVPPLLNFITERRGCCAGVRSSRTLVRDSQRPLWFLVSTYRHKLPYLAFHLVSYSLLAFFCSNVATIKVLRDAFLFRNLWARHCSRCQGNQSHERGASKAWRRACFEVARLQGSDKLMSWISWMFHSTLLFWRFYH